MSFKDKFQPFHNINSQRLLLRRLTEDDAGEYYKIITNSSVTKYMGNSFVPKSIEEARDRINGLAKNCDSGKSYRWAITLKENNVFIGFIELGNFVKGSMTDISYFLSEDKWNNGYTTEAVTAVIKFGFEHMQFHRIQATVAVENAASIKVLLKSGFTDEGILKEYSFGNEFRDVHMLSILKREYKQ